MSRILFRCDASLLIGSGHVMRCRTLARELRRRGAAVAFLCRRHPGDLIGKLEQEFQVLALPKLPVVNPDGLQEREFYGDWLGCSQAQDAAQCLQALAQAGIHNASWVVVDHYGLDATWETQLLAGLDGAALPNLLAIDDLADRSHQADLLLDQNFYGAATEERYSGLLPAHCLQLLGPHYALLGAEYAQLHPLVPPRRELRRVLVFFGGVDTHNLTRLALEGLMAPELAHLAVDVVVGPQAPHRAAVAELVARRPQTTLHGQLPSLAGLIARADLAIGAGGSTTWERACLGVPTLVVTLASNQLPITEALDSARHLKHLGEAATITAEQICEALLKQATEPFEAKGGKDLVDGWGAARLATAMLGPQNTIRLRPATPADEDLLLRWANDPQVRDNSFSPEPISPDVHRKWFQRAVTDANRLLMIATDTEGCPLGQIRFDRNSTTADHHVIEARVGLSLDRCARGHDLSARLVKLGLAAMEHQWGPATEAVAEVLSSNGASNACFARAGFVSDAFPGNSPAEPVTVWRWRPGRSPRASTPAAGTTASWHVGA